jgi:hypothetical protein
VSDQAEAVPLQTYTLQLIGPADDFERSRKRREEWERIWATYFRETKENLTDLLPPSYSVRIRKWDE